jgi:hypothetical protein
MPEESPYSDARREQHGKPKIVEIKPAATVPKAVANAKTLVDQAKS